MSFKRKINKSFTNGTQQNEISTLLSKLYIALDKCTDKKNKNYNANNQEDKVKKCLDKLIKDFLDVTNDKKNNKKNLNKDNKDKNNKKNNIDLTLNQQKVLKDTGNLEIFKKTISDLSSNYYLFSKEQDQNKKNKLSDIIETLKVNLSSIISKSLKKLNIKKKKYIKKKNKKRNK